MIYIFMRRVLVIKSKEKTFSIVEEVESIGEEKEPCFCSWTLFRKGGIVTFPEDEGSFMES